MISNNFLWGIVWRTTAMTLFIVGSSFTVYKSAYIVTPIMLSLLAMVCFVSLILHLQKIHKGWSKFLLSINYNDFSTASGDSKDFPLLKEAYDSITTTFKKISSGRQGEQQFLQTIYEHVPVGLISFNKEGKLLFINSAFKALFQFESLIHINKLIENHSKVHAFLTQSWGRNESQLFEIDNQRVLVKRESFELHGALLQIASFHDIKSTLDANEEESYHRLLRVLTHEIMNSATPILSLTRVVNNKLVEGHELKVLGKKDQQNIAISLKAIEERTLGITRFVEGYKQINKELVPKKKRISIETFATDLRILLEKENVNLNLVNEILVEAVFDRDLITQVILNLVKNAHEALPNDDSGFIEFHIKRQENSLMLVIMDNGSGVPEEVATEMFIPFFSTKQNGSGIGLALSRKIIRAHGGTLEYKRDDGLTQFHIELPDVIVSRNEHSDVLQQ